MRNISVMSETLPFKRGRLVLFKTPEGLRLCITHRGEAQPEWDPSLNRIAELRDRRQGRLKL